MGGVWRAAQCVRCLLILCLNELFRGCIGINDLMINEEIRDREVRVVDQDGANSWASCPFAQALELAEEKQLDLGQDRAAGPAAGVQADGLRKVSALSSPRRNARFRKNQKVITD